LVLGAGGLLGRHLLALGAAGLTRQQCDVTDPRQREAVLERYRPAAVIYAAAQADVDRCEADRSSAEVNVHAAAAWARRVPLWYVSSNYVFSGAGPHEPGDAPAPLQRYGRQKLAAERAVLATGGHVVRTGWLYGHEGRGFASRLPALLRLGPVSALRSPAVQPTWAGDLAALLLTLPEGLNHAVGREEASWADFATLIAGELGLEDRVVPVDALPQALPAARPSDVRLAPATLPGWRRSAPRLLEPWPPPRPRR